MSLPVFDLNTTQGRAGFDCKLKQLRQTANTSSDAAKIVAEIVSDVQTRGDDAIVHYMQKWTDPNFSQDQICVRDSEFNQAVEQLDGRLKEALEASISHVRQYQQHIMPITPAPINLGGAEMGLRFTPVQSAGMCVPGGAAVLFSTVIMLAVPAQVAGVAASDISIINPPPTRVGDQLAGDISPIVLATCAMLGISKVYRIGGAQAVAALAYGTQQVDRVAMIAGPGNIFVQIAKQQIAGVTGTDGGFYGPSEIVTIADDSADAACVASDLIAQAEHAPGKCFLIAWSKAVLEAIMDQVVTQMAQRSRVRAIEAALTDESAAILVSNEDQAAEIADRIAAEHVHLAVREPDAWLERLRYGGEFFLGHQTPVAAGDYYAGPSHCLPTGSTARFASGISVYTFLNRSGTVCYRQGMDSQTIEHIALLAQTEGLDAHANSARIRAKLAD